MFIFKHATSFSLSSVTNAVDLLELGGLPAESDLKCQNNRMFLTVHVLTHAQHQFRPDSKPTFYEWNHLVLG